MDTRPGPIQYVYPLYACNTQPESYDVVHPCGSHSIWTFVPLIGDFVFFLLLPFPFPQPPFSKWGPPRFFVAVQDVEKCENLKSVSCASVCVMWLSRWYTGTFHSVACCLSSISSLL